MELREYWRLFRRRWWIPVLLMALVGIFSAWQLKPWQAQPLNYAVSMRMLIGVAPEEEADSTAYDPLYYAWLTSEYVVDDFTEIVRSGLFAENVSRRLADQNIEVPANLIEGSATAGKQHRIITLSMSWPDQAQLATIADAIAAELQENAGFYFRQLRSENAAVTLLDSPNVVVVRPGLRNQLDLPLRMLLAFLFGVGLVYLLAYLDTSIHDRSELEAMGLQVLGEIPRDD